MRGLTLPAMVEFKRAGEACYQVAYQTKTGVITSTIFYSNLIYYENDVLVTAKQAATSYLEKIKGLENACVR